jgi:hypothetical protein
MKLKAFSFFTVLLFSLAASGHTPGDLEEEVRLATLEQSWALYGGFEKGDETYVIEIDLEEGIGIPLEILVPEKEENKDHRPMFAVVGPGLAEPTEEERALLPYEVPEGMGVFLERHNREERAEFYEAFTRTHYWTSEAVALQLDPGTHEIWIFSPEGTTGDFTLGLGVEEAWGLSDIFGLMTGQVGPEPVDLDR